MDTRDSHRKPLSIPEQVTLPRQVGRQHSADSLPVQIQGCQAGLLTLHMSSLGLNVVFQMWPPMATQPHHLCLHVPAHQASGLGQDT